MDGDPRSIKGMIFASIGRRDGTSANTTTFTFTSSEMAQRAVGWCRGPSSGCDEGTKTYYTKNKKTTIIIVKSTTYRRGQRQMM
mmetsp:Transcript_26531/g.39775  ORF Transcript_26531/g.39775 Transcript_26531/m.39775 type:complete len:84 (-) Transcript_26531:293-544(-)